MTLLLDDEAAVLLESDSDDASSISMSDLAVRTPERTDDDDGIFICPQDLSSSTFSDSFEFCSTTSSAAGDGTTTASAADDDIFFGQRRRVSSAKAPLPPHHRRSRTLAPADHRKLKHAAPETEPRPHPVPLKATSRSAVPQLPRWFVFVFGPMRVPTSMEMKDIKFRQSRRRSSPPHTAEHGGGTWPKLIRSLSCKAVESAVVVASPLVRGG